MKAILLKGGLKAFVDDEDYELVNQYKWCPKLNRRGYGDVYYAIRYYTEDGVKKTMLMHSLIMGTLLGDAVVDHKNGDGLLNTRNNLRKCTHRENAMNRRHRVDGTSVYKGVHLMKGGKYRSSIGNGKHIKLGCFSSEEKAAKRYDLYALKLFGEFASLNFPDLMETYVNMLSAGEDFIPDQEESKSCKYRGVYYDASRNKYAAELKFKNKRIRIGRFVTAKDAAIAYDNCVIEVGANRSWLNLPERVEC